jgi:hypothetical protein
MRVKLAQDRNESKYLGQVNQLSGPTTQENSWRVEYNNEQQLLKLRSNSVELIHSLYAHSRFRYQHMFVLRHNNYTWLVSEGNDTLTVIYRC